MSVGQEPERPSQPADQKGLESNLKMTVVAEAPKRDLWRLREIDLSDTQAKLVGVQKTTFIKPPLNGFDDLRMEENIWYNKALESLIISEIGKSIGSSSRPVHVCDGEEPRAQSAECIRIYFQRADDGEKGEEYELPGFTADLRSNGKQLKLKFIVIWDAMNVWRLKKKEAQIVDLVQIFLQNQTVDDVGNQQHFKCNIRQHIAEAMGLKIHGCEIANGKTGEPAAMQVFIKELIVYDRGPNAHFSGIE